MNIRYFKSNEEDTGPMKPSAYHEVDQHGTIRNPARKLSKKTKRELRKMLRQQEEKKAADAV